MAKGVLEVLRADEMCHRWVEQLEALDGPEAEAALPSPEELPATLLDLAVPHEDINRLTALRATVTGDAGLRRLLERCVRLLVRDIGRAGGSPWLPELPGRLLPGGPDDLGRCFYVYVYLAALPHVRAYHRERGVPDHISRHTLADLGRHMALRRRRHGTIGLLNQGWTSLHFRGEIYQLGRLQFQRSVLGDRTGEAVAAAGLPLGPGSPVLAVHIPDFSGPLTPAACDTSVALAQEFFPRHFPETPYTVATCDSWLLDPQLPDHLPADSNIVRFQRRFHPAYELTQPNDTNPVRFVFGDPDLPPESLPRRTLLERIVTDHLLAGGHWYGGSGWFEL